MSDDETDSGIENFNYYNPVCPRVTYLSGKECTLAECKTVRKMKLYLSLLNAWIPHEIMVLKNGKELDNDDPAPETASVLWKENEETNWSVWCHDLKLLANFNDQVGANRCASKVLRMNAERAMENFMKSSRNGNVSIVEAYISAGIDEESLGKALYRSSSNGHLRIVNALLLANAHVNYSSDALQGRTPLHESCRCGHVDITKALIAARANVNAVDRDNCTPFSLSRDFYHSRLQAHVLVEEENYRKIWFVLRCAGAVVDDGRKESSQ